MSRDAEQLERLLEIMSRLRAPDGCPWDREQSLGTLRPYLVEEAFEVLDAMDDVVARGEGDVAAMKELCTELGDLLFQIVFHAQLGKERGAFTFADVAQAISDKIVRRHPHVFGAERVEGSAQVLANWAKLKEAERREKGEIDPSALDGIPRQAPALVRAERTGEKAARVGFDWKDAAGPRKKIDEELRELDDAIAGGDRERIEDELGDLLFSVCNLSRFTKTPPEDALRKAIRRFEERFRHVERSVRSDGLEMTALSEADLDGRWNAAKAALAAAPKPTP